MSKRNSNRYLSAALALILIAFVFTAQAEVAFGGEIKDEIAPDVYIVAAHPYYAHPVTGVMEDSGQNPGIGQGMTESVLGKEALLEVYEDGSMYVTVRFSLMDNIQNVNLSVQKDADSAYLPVTYAVTQEFSGEGADAKRDIRFEIPSVSALARAEAFVTAMGRDVIFFMNFSDPVLGSGDFVTTADGTDGAFAPEKTADGESDVYAAGETPRSGGAVDAKTFVIIAAAIVVAAVVIALIARARYARKKENEKENE